MDLSIKDVAELLSVSQSTVGQWIEAESIPSYRVGNNHYFSRIEIEDWVFRGEPGKSPFKRCDDEVESAGSQQYSLFRAIHRGGVLHQVDGEGKEEVIRRAMETIAVDLGHDAEILTEMLLDREKLQPTAIGGGIGLPHTRESFVNALYDRVVISFPKRAIGDYGALDGEAVHTLFFLFACDDKRHLHLLAKIAHFASSREMRELLQKRPSKVKLLSAIKEWEREIGKQPRG